MNDPGRAGNLAFSRSSTDAPRELESREFSLVDLMTAAEDVEAGRPVDPELLKALHPGTGGARPKCNVVDGDGVWIAKFPSIDDKPGVSIPRLEHASMMLAGRCGVDAARTRLELVEGRPVCFVKRFDREVVSGGIARKSFISARSVFYSDPGFEQMGAIGSYARLARRIKRYGCTDGDIEQLYRRMIFNAAIRNSDDHELNHGLVGRAGAYRLSAAFDVLPTINQNRIQRHALLLGDNADGTVQNLLSNASAFGLSPSAAQDIVRDVLSLVREHWLDALYEAGFDDAGVHLVEHCFAALPESRELAATPDNRH